MYVDAAFLKSQNLTSLHFIDQTIQLALPVIETGCRLPAHVANYSKNFLKTNRLFSGKIINIHCR